MIRCLLILTMLLSALPCWAADGIQVDVSFKVPYAVDGKIVPNRAEVKLVDGRPMLRVIYLAGEDLPEVWYTLERQQGPSPNPQPQPNPDPAPTPKIAFLYLIHESADSSPEQAAVRQAKPWKDALDAAGVRWIIFDDDEGQKTFPQATQQARAKGLPALVLLDAAGKATVEPVPASSAAMLARVQAIVKGGAR